MGSRIIESLKTLMTLRINVPMIMFTVEESKPTESEARLKAMLHVTRGKRFIAPPGYDIINRDELRNLILAMEGIPEVIFVAPKSNSLIEGICTPGPYYNKIQIGDSVNSVAWGTDPIAFPEGLRRGIMDLNSALQLHRHALDGMPLRFTFHPRGEGINQERIIIWGSPIEG